MKEMVNVKKGFISPTACKAFISTEYGIKVDVGDIKGRPSIKLYNHLSLFSMIGKIRRHFDFTVLHRKEKNEYILIIGNKIN